MTHPHETDGGAAPRHTLLVCPPLGDEELNALFSASWPDHRSTAFQRQLRHSMLWVAAVRDGRLDGYVKVVGDGGVHAFLLDPTVRPDERGRGLGAKLVRRAADEARRRGAEWLHVDFEPHLSRFYARCGFRPAPAGLMRLTGPGPGPG
ncbi:Acetyltransferase (GNAT) domain-containing protein [Streptomyces sp. WMMB 714]|uniref:GNAT family N-acetyltransferase n=1 Tax=Streptomyces sp. WMMB 714 TaxID=1286822 RepID=UPI000823D095|nr:GNAT family N-acetyltransferase [Streptomyces sp. WMMB 714]SCK16882.1 Acetyltransferase (GNAT) domain-containing protein [Streptomyces sp. WMMB 714]